MAMPITSCFSGWSYLGGVRGLETKCRRGSSIKLHSARTRDLQEMTSTGIYYGTPIINWIQGPAASATLLGVGPTELQAPLADGIISEYYTTLGHHFLDIAK